MVKVSLVLFVLLGLLALTNAHSWVQCVDYTEENGQYWDAAKCRGWPRDYARAFQYVSPPYVFGGDAGYNYPPTDAAPCKTKPSAGDYTTTYPAAKYSPGQRVCMAWPPKNHVAAACGNRNTPDAGTKIYRSGLNPTTDPTLTQFRTNLVADLGTNAGLNGTGFQNCPNFCADPGAALCTGCFNIPPNLALGKYTFLWEWAFNGPNDLFANCADVEIVANSGNTITKTFAKISPDEFKAQLAAGGAPATSTPAPPAAPGTPSTPAPGGTTPAPGGATPAPGGTTPAPAPDANQSNNNADAKDSQSKNGSNSAMPAAAAGAIAVLAIVVVSLLVLIAMYVTRGQIFGYHYDQTAKGWKKATDPYQYSGARS